MSRTIGLFVEDEAHEKFIRALVIRMGREHGVGIDPPHSRSASGGHGKVVAEYKQYLRDLQRQGENYYDLVIVGTDANCSGHQQRLKEITKAGRNCRLCQVVCAIPEPHIERWFLLDSLAFKKVFGRGCNAPDLKCDRDRYKELLRSAIAEAIGRPPLLGGIEHAESLVKKLDLKGIEKQDPSFNHFLKSLRGVFKSWTQGESA